MKVLMLVLHRKESYPREFAPEVLAIVDEWTLDENPSWWPQEIAKHKAAVGDDASAWAIVEATLDTNTLMAALYPSGSLGTLDITPVAETPDGA